MAAPTYTHNINFSAPALPYASPLYDPTYFNKFNDILRIYFNQLDEALRDGSTQINSESMTWFMS